MKHPAATLLLVLLVAFAAMTLSWHISVLVFLYFALAFALSLHTLLFLDNRILHALRFASGVAAIASVAFVLMYFAFADERSVASLVLSGLSFGIFWLVMRFFPKPLDSEAVSWGDGHRAILVP